MSQEKKDQIHEAAKEIGAGIAIAGVAIGVAIGGAIYFCASSSGDNDKPTPELHCSYTRAATNLPADEALPSGYGPDLTPELARHIRECQAAARQLTLNGMPTKIIFNFKFE